MLFFFSVEFGLQALEGDLQQPARQAAALMDRLLLWQVSQDCDADDIMDPAVASSHTIPCCGLDKNLCKRSCRICKNSAEVEKLSNTGGAEKLFKLHYSLQV